ncbi:EamA family transporter RarD [Vibrio sp. SS-MA-C1-2]|uniref:EamA family transporter RarD n=1 Tax=Vibrio sp. SS-MA-C1-2 TaxID=2908646 RepID=UPI001F403DA8|nr:EamA family transporter RarD [Vibrio sp. SS-MA-C1-2]UJF18323.1 EamA family transporter RarD [Vibrio sp. SS-MA-C1-2]
MFSNLKGSSHAVIAYLLWGLIPLYFHFLYQANMNELISLRIIFSLPLVWLVKKLFRVKSVSLSTALKNKKSLLLCFIAGSLNIVSLYAFTWALTTGQVLAASLGYFMTPIFTIMLGILFLKDKLTIMQKLAVLLAIIGLSYQVFSNGELPWLSLIMGSFFAVYGLVKKYIKFDTFTTLYFELFTILPFALIYMLVTIFNGDSTAFNSDLMTLFLYIGAAPVTLLPLIFFAIALKKTTLTVIGLIQYLEPSIHFVLAVVLFNEQMELSKFISFSFIWLGLILCSLEAWRNRAKVKTQTLTEAYTG